MAQQNVNYFAWTCFWAGQATGAGVVLSYHAVMKPSDFLVSGLVFVAVCIVGAVLNFLCILRQAPQKPPVAPQQDQQEDRWMPSVCSTHRDRDPNCLACQPVCFKHGFRSCRWCLQQERLTKAMRQDVDTFRRIVKGRHDRGA